MKKPIIGIVAKHRDVSLLRPDVVIRDEIKDSVIENGGIPIGLVPPSKEIVLTDYFFELSHLDEFLSKKDKEVIVAQIKLCDGIVLQGGIKSDLYEAFVSKYCYEKDIPLLAICAGQNNMVRGLGGNNKPIENVDKHNQPTEDYVHEIFIDKNSNFYKIIGSERLMVNSRHKNVIDTHPNLDVVAFDEDGNIEVVESKDKRFFIGMRFHPESLYEKDPLHNKIIKTFVDACQKEFSLEKQ